MTNQKSKNKIIVTGGAGFIGSHLCEALVKGNNIVASIDNYSTGSSENHIDGVQYINGHTVDISSLAPFKPSIIYHLGEYSRVEQSFEEIQKIWDFNKIGTYSILQYCIKNNVKIVYAGSSTKFGDGGLGRSDSPYGWSKASNTELIINYGNWYDLNFAITYFYNAYGHREICQGKYATLIGLFRQKMKCGESLTVVAPGTQERNFTHVSDIVSGLIKVGDHGYGDEYGIGSDETFTILEIAKIFGGKIKMLSERKGNRMSAEVITAKTKALGWQSTYNIKNYIEILRNNDWDDINI